MKLPLLSRRIHYWAAIIASAPALVIIATGLLLQLKKDVPWVQPAERRGDGKEPTISFAQVLEACRKVPEAKVQSWADVHRIDIRPSRGLIKVTTTTNWEVQINAQTGDVMQSAYRRSDVIESIHDGSWFHEQAKLWVFFPAGALLLLLWCTGMYLFWLPRWVRWRRKPPLAVSPKC